VNRSSAEGTLVEAPKAPRGVEVRRGCPPTVQCRIVFAA